MTGDAPQTKMNTATEFPAGAITNVNVIDGFTNLSCRLYWPTQIQTSGYDQKNLMGSLELTALTLRNAGCLASVAFGGYGLWTFAGDEDFDALRQFTTGEGDSTCNSIVVDSFTLSNAVSGTTSLSTIVKRLDSEPSSSLFQNPWYQGGGGSPPPAAKLIQHLISTSSVYEAFISAVSGLLRLRATSIYDAIPLGRQTLFLPTEPESYEAKDDMSSVVGSVPCLSTHGIDVTPQGKVIVSWRSTSQYGLERLSHTTLSTGMAYLSTFNEDLWIAPTGTICRYISIIRGTCLSPEVENWKKTVTTWLQQFGLGLDDSEAFVWVELEMKNPMSPQENPTGTDQSGSGISNPMSRILWPATYCFKRAKLDSPSSKYGTLPTQVDTPLKFAEQWMADSVSVKASGATSKPAQLGDKLDDASSKVASPSVPKGDVPDTIETLARTINYPDPSAFNAVYPTPPGGPLGPNSAAMGPADGPDPVTSYVLNNSGEDQGTYPAEDIPSASYRTDSDAVLGAFDVPPSQVGVGSGMYDTTGDDDLFGDMDEDFGPKEITEADFNFFDEPDFGGFGETTSSTQQHPPEEGPAAASVIQPTSEPVSSGEAFVPGQAGMTGLTPIDDTQPTQTSEPITEDTATNHIGTKDGDSQAKPLLSPSEVRDMISNQEATKEGLRTDRMLTSQYRFGPVPFKSTVGSSDQKYALAGRFWFNADQMQERPALKNADQPPDIPTLGLPSKKPFRFSEPSHLYADLALSDGMHSGRQSPSSFSEQSSDNESQLSVVISDASTPPSPRGNAKRKRSPALPSESHTPSLQLASGVEGGILPANYSSFLGNLIFKSTAWSLAGYFSRRQSEIAPVLAPAEELTQVAQLVVDQTTQSSFLHGARDVSRSSPGDGSLSVVPDIIDTTQLVDKGQKLDLGAYSSIEAAADDSNPKQKETPVQGQPQPGGRIFKLNPPYVRTHRGGRSLETLPPAIPFWETFGLQPLLGQKDIVSYCIHPHNAEDDADAFLSRISATYLSASFGSHSWPPDGKGLIPWTNYPNGDDGYASWMSGLQHICETLGTDLPNLPQTDENVVVYILNPFSHAAALADICSAFLQLFQKYVEGSARRSTRHFHELVLQIVPLHFVMRPDSLVVPPQLDYLRLSLEVYSRCAPKGRDMDWSGCAPPLVLAKSIPRGIPFKLSPESAPPMEDCRALHLAYSHSVDQRWITAAWTDSPGRHQMNMSYCLRERGSSVCRPVAKVLEDIWGATQEILGVSRRHWRVMIVKNEAVDPEEVTAWTTLVQKHNQVRLSKVDLTILSVDTCPGLLFKIPPSQPQLGSISQQVVQSSSQENLTPISPNPAILSPEPSSTVSTPYPVTSLHTPPDQPSHSRQTSQSQQQQQHPTPSTDSDKEQTILVDKSDDTWALTLSHQLNNSHTPTTYRPAQASGYLVRRRGISDTEGLASLAVNVIYFQLRVPADVILKDVMRMYRELATLSRTRGIAHSQGDCPLPWHIATAVYGQEALSYIF